VSSDGTLVAAPDLDNGVMLYPNSGAEALPALGVEPGQIPVQWGSDNQTLVVFQPGNSRPASTRWISGWAGRLRGWTFLPPAQGVSVIDVVWLTPDGTSHVYPVKRLLSQLYIVDGLL